MIDGEKNPSKLVIKSELDSNQVQVFICNIQHLQIKIRHGYV